MAEVMDFQKAKLEREPHTAGPMRCLTCGHEWVGVVPCGNDTAECPVCKTEKGVRTQHVGPPEEHPAWRCHCGSWVFGVIREGCVCINCGQFHDWDAIAEE